MVRVHADRRTRILPRAQITVGDFLSQTAVKIAHLMTKWYLPPA